MFCSVPAPYLMGPKGLRECSVREKVGLVVNMGGVRATVTMGDAGAQLQCDSRSAFSCSRGVRGGRFVVFFCCLVHFAQALVGSNICCIQLVGDALMGIGLHPPHTGQYCLFATNESCPHGNGHGAFGVCAVTHMPPHG